MSTKTSKPVLPTALRDTEITEGDLAVMLRVVQDKKVRAGRYKRKPKRVASANPARAAKD